MLKEDGKIIAEISPGDIIIQERIYLPLWWRHLGILPIALARYPLSLMRLEPHCSDAMKYRVHDVRRTRDGWNIYPPQHFIASPFGGFKRHENTKPPQPLYRMNENRVYLNKKYFETALDWLNRSIASDSLMPELERLFIAPHAPVLVSEADAAMFEAPEAWIKTQETMLQERLWGE